MKILGIGNAIVDVICKVEDNFITQNNLTKSTMKLVDEAEFKKLLSTLKIEETVSGGSIANSIVGLSQLGNKVGFIGKVSDDELGNKYEIGLKKEKVNYATDRIPSDVTVGDDSIVITKNQNGTNLKRKKLNPSWDSTATYIPRKDRKEWDIVGLMGKLKVKSDQPVGTKWIKIREVSASVHEYLIR